MCVGINLGWAKSRLRPRGISRVLLVGCGTSYQLAQAAACNFESVCDVPAFAYSAGEFCAGGVVCDRGALVVGISASGQTAEVAEALQKAAALSLTARPLSATRTPFGSCRGTLLSLPCSLPGGLPPVTHFVLGYVLLALVAVGDWGLRQKTITPLFGHMAVKLCATLPDKLRLILKSGSELDALAAYLTGYDRLLLWVKTLTWRQRARWPACGAVLWACRWRRCLRRLRHTLLPTVDSHTALVALISSLGTDGKNLRCPATGGHSRRGYGGLHGREPGRQPSGARQYFCFRTACLYWRLCASALPCLCCFCGCAPPGSRPGDRWSSRRCCPGILPDRHV